jgi:hypothetical protein
MAGVMQKGKKSGGKMVSEPYTAYSNTDYSELKI